MSLTKQQIEALSDLYEVMEKHDLSFDAVNLHNDPYTPYVEINHKNNDLDYFNIIDSSIIKNILDENKGVSDENLTLN